MTTNNTYLNQAFQLLIEERSRQIEDYGYSLEHDLAMGHNDLILAAATYEMEAKDREEMPASWPWDFSYWKPTASQGTQGRIRELVKAGALYMAAKAVMEAKRLDIPLKQAVCQKVDLMAEMIAELLGKEEVLNG
jgi:hypothetical protein